MGQEEDAESTEKTNRERETMEEIKNTKVPMFSSQNHAVGICCGGFIQKVMEPSTLAALRVKRHVCNRGVEPTLF